MLYKTDMQEAERMLEDSIDADAILMTRVSGGDEHALRMLIEKWKNPLLNFFRIKNLSLHK